MLQPELKMRRDKIRELMTKNNIDAALIACNVNLLYTYGRIVCGYLYLPLNSPAILFIKKPSNIKGEHIVPIHKAEEIPNKLQTLGIPAATKIMLEGDELPYTQYIRLSNLFPNAEIVNGTPFIRKARSTKTSYEIELFRRSAKSHENAYKQIPSVYKEDMTDLDFSIEIERLMRKEGCLGIFRVFGQSMEIFMGSVLTGNNAAAPSPYSFALGGEGLDNSIPGGANKTPLKEGQSVMVDMGGNFYGYLSDMSRVFSIGKLTDEAYAAHETCLKIQNTLKEMIKPKVYCEDVYYTALEIVKKDGFADNFMGIKDKARFVGHGIGLEINEEPVFAPHIRTELEEGMVFALEPKIIIPNVGPVGIENSWAVTSTGVEKLTDLPEEIIDLQEQDEK
jgi:Xaa-Pro dipeptidase